MSQVPQQGPPSMPPFGQPGQVVEFLKFQKMITPVVIQVLFWIGLVGCVIGALVSFGQARILSGLGMLILGPLLVRIYCELIIVMFRIRDLLETIRDNTHR